MEAGPACVLDAGIVIPGFDGGGMNKACETCLNASCATTGCECLNDPNTNKSTDCYAYATCVYLDFADAGAGAVTNCATGIPTGSQTLGKALFNCILNGGTAEDGGATPNCSSQCL